MKVINLFKRFYGFCFYRCFFCGKRISAQFDTCSPECEELAAEAQTFSF